MCTNRTTSTINGKPAVRADIHMEKIFSYSPENNKYYPGNGIINVTTLQMGGGVGGGIL